ncbi:MAG: F0F1 ATP synthase subunit delta [Bacteroidales bacterium]|nr:F0F1 ATP synthase subunit delta [Bacteroidales bacterium]
MNTGLIAERYAKALLAYVARTGRGQEVFTQALALLREPKAFREPLEEDLAALVQLLRKRGRLEYAKLILLFFTRMYARAEGIRLARLTTVVPAPGLEARLRAELGGNVLIESRIDPALTGGFILEVDDRMLDASVASRLDRIRRQYVMDNKRTV